LAVKDKGVERALRRISRRSSATVLETAGRFDEAAEAYREALDRYERKQIIPLTRRVRQRLEALQPTPL
jgi:hypothetical protein